MGSELGNETDVDLLLVSPVTSPANLASIVNDDFMHYGILTRAGSELKLNICLGGGGTQILAIEPPRLEIFPSHDAMME